MKKVSMLRTICLSIKDYAHGIRVFGGVLFFIALLTGILWLAGYKYADASAYIIQLLSGVLLGAPAIADYFLGTKPINQMSSSEMLDYIQTTSPTADWSGISSNDITECFLKIDPRLRLKIKYSKEGIQNRNYIDGWANTHLDSNATGYWCELSYNGNVFEKTILVSIDGGRALLPTPEINTTIISKKNYHIAKIFDQLNTLDEYIRRSKLSVSET